MMRFNNIHAARRRFAKRNGKFTQQQAADRFGVSLRTYQNWEQGRTETSAAMLCVLADTYGVTVDYLLGRTDVPDGYKTPAGRPSADLSHEQLADLFDSSDDLGKSAILATAALAARNS